MSLHLGATTDGASFSLPLDAATRRLAILAMSGAGKSNAAVVLAEAMYDAGIPWVAVDPKGDWYGVRASADGAEPGLPIPIFGGRHGDVPLEAHAGKVIGRLIVERRLTCVLDVSLFDNQDRWGFLHDLGETLLRQPPQVLHLFLEEAADYIPQSTREGGNQPKCLGTWQRIVKLGRTIGLGSTQITQRSASLNKDTLYMADCLIALRTAGPGDIKTIKGWVEHSGAAPEILRSLPSLEDGEAWVSSPGWLRSTKRIRFDRRRTYDSGSTPVMLEGGARAATLADVDLAALGEEIAATIARAAEDDPKALRRRVAELERELSTRPPPASVKELSRLSVENADLRSQLAEASCDHEPIIADLEGRNAQLYIDVQAAKRNAERLAAELDHERKRIDAVADALNGAIAGRLDIYDILFTEGNDANTGTSLVRHNSGAAGPQASDRGLDNREARAGRADAADRGDARQGRRRTGAIPTITQSGSVRQGESRTRSAGSNRRTEDMTDEEVRALVKQAVDAAVAAIPGARVEVLPVEYIRHEYQRKAVERIIDRVGALKDDEREAVRFMLGQGDRLVSNADISKALSGYQGGAAQVKWGTAVKGLVSAGVVSTIERQGSKPRIREWVEDMLGPHSPTTAKVDETYQAVLGRIAGANA